MLKVYRKLYEILDARERWLTLLVFSFMILVAMLETVGVASIMPFMAVLANPGVVKSNHYLAKVYARLDFHSTNHFLFFLGVVFLVLVVGSQIVKALALWMQFRFSNTRNYSWSSRLIKNYLNQPYEWFLTQHSGMLGASVLDEINKVVHEILFPAIQIISNALVAIFLLGLMLVTDPMLALTVALVLGAAYITLYYFIRRYVRHIGEEGRMANRYRFKIAQEAFGGVKDVKVAGLENIFVERYKIPAAKMTRHETRIKILSELPSFVMQALVLGGIMVMLLYFLSKGNGLQKILPVFSLYAFAGYRMMPSLQSIYRYLSKMRYSMPVLDGLYPDLKMAHNKEVATKVTNESETFRGKSIGLREKLELRNICYRYPDADGYSLNAINMTVQACTTVGLVGSTGSGKTTLVDLLLCLLPPESGELSADGVRITPELRHAWQRSIGYVQQHIYLLDDTIKANVAFGIPLSQIDQSAVENAARAANLHDFVNDLPDGYDTIVGERGVRLSGGQRQRIGIARALYRDPDVLILDEATSALDNLTEQAVMEAVYNLGKKKTIILIAHRLSTVRDCDQIFYLEKGRIIEAGSFEELMETNPMFRQMAGASE